MNIKLELLKNYITDFISNNIENIEIDASKIADSVAISMLSEIQNIIRDEKNSDFDAIEKIVCLFENITLILALVTIFSKQKTMVK